MNAEKEAQLKYLGELLGQYAYCQEYTTFCEMAPKPLLYLNPNETRGQRIVFWREERDKAREQIIRLFL